MKEITIENAMKVDRPKMGGDIPVGLFRLVRLVAFEEILGEGAAGLAFQAGERLGKSLGIKDLKGLVKACEDLKIGDVKISEESDNKIHVDVYECVTCSGMEPVGRPICHFEGGLIAGAINTILNKKVKVKEVTCIGGLGDETCGFDIDVL